MQGEDLAPGRKRKGAGGVDVIELNHRLTKENARMQDELLASTKVIADLRNRLAKLENKPKLEEAESESEMEDESDSDDYEYNSHPSSSEEDDGQLDAEMEDGTLPKQDAVGQGAVKQSAIPALLASGWTTVQKNKKTKRTQNKVKVPKQAPALNRLQGQKSVVPVSKTPRKRLREIPDIKVECNESRTLTLKLKNKLGHTNFTLKVLGNLIVIKSLTLDDFKTTRLMLKEENFNFYTYTPKSEMPFSVIINGLCNSWEESEVKSFLESLQTKVEILRLVKLGRKRWLIHLSRETDIASFYKIKQILTNPVKISKDSKPGLSQCKNCQRFHHIAANCGFGYRCCKCGNTHGPGKCEIPPASQRVENDSNLVTDPVTGKVTRASIYKFRCVNCGVDGHAASDKNCPVRQRLLQEKKNSARRLNAANMVRPPPNGGFIRSGVSFAAIARGGSSSATVAAPVGGAPIAEAMTHFNVLNSECKKLLGGDFMVIMEKVRAFVPHFNALRSSTEKSQALWGLMLSVNNVAI